MATYKVIQDIEAEDKLVGPLTLRQFIYAGISAFSLWLSFIGLTKHAAIILVFLVPIALLSGFLAAPWGGDQPTEIWAVAKLRFLLKPRKRIWDQSGTKELVTITAPKSVERSLTNGLNQTEVQNRLSALANTIDSRGWAIKNVNLNLNAMQTGVNDSDRLIDASMLPREVSNIDVTPADDIMDASANPVAHNFDSMMAKAADQHRQSLIQQMQQSVQTNPQSTLPAPPIAAAQQTPVSQETAAATPGTAQTASSQPVNYWFMQQQPPVVAGQATFVNTSVVTPGDTSASEPASLPHAAVPTAEEEAFVAAKSQEVSSTITNTYSHLKTLKTPVQLAEEEARAAQQQAAAQAELQRKAQVTSDKQAAIINLANNDDLNIATLARQAHKNEGDNGEVVISLR